MKSWRNVGFWLDFVIGIGLEKPNSWAFDTTQFDNILRRLKVVCTFRVLVFKIRVTRF
jgi:hypothetical protein